MSLSTQLLLHLKSYYYGLCVVGNFTIADGILVLDHDIVWPNGGQAPLDTPSCGFQDEFCLNDYASCEMVAGIIGGIAVVISIVLLIAYRSYKYEQELDSLLWKINPEDLVLAVDPDDPNEDDVEGFIDDVDRQHFLGGSKASSSLSCLIYHLSRGKSLVF